MVATLLRRALQLRRVLPSPSSRALLPAASNRLLSTTNPTQQNTTAIRIDLSSGESRRRLVNSLMYRSKQRGFLELDLVLGTWVEQHIRTMDEANIRSLLQVLDLCSSHYREERNTREGRRLKQRRPKPSSSKSPSPLLPALSL